MHILYVEAHYEGAHQDWIDGYRARSQHHITMITMPGGDWRWRLHAGAIHLANLFHQQRAGLPPIDMVLINGMASASLFLAATRPHLDNLPVAIYIQENQLNYPTSPDEEDLWQNGAIVQATSAYVADLIAFNGDYLKQDFIDSLWDFTAKRDYADRWVDRVAARSIVLRRGINLIERFGEPPKRSTPSAPITFLWSHRWAYEKGVHDFAAALRQLHADNVPFQVILAGSPWNNAALLADLVSELGDRVLSHGALYGQDYINALRRADVMVACSLNEPLGVSMLEAMYMGCYPILPERGSFPMMLPKRDHDLLYDGSVDGLVARMREVALNPRRAYRPQLSQVAAQYDWSNLVAHYDATFEKFVQDYRA